MQRNQQIISASGTKKAFPASEERLNQSGCFLLYLNVFVYAVGEI
jgi:hypothetical protein